MRYHLAKRKAGCYNAIVKIFLSHYKDGRLISAGGGVYAAKTLCAQKEALRKEVPPSAFVISRND